MPSRSIRSTSHASVQEPVLKLTRLLLPVLIIALTWLVPRGFAELRTANTITISAMLPSARIGVPYSATLTVSGGTSPYQFTISYGALPPGLTLNGNTGVISGVATAVGSYTFTVRVTDLPALQRGAKSLTLSVLKQEGGQSQPPPISVSVSPASATVSSGGTQQFHASVLNTSNTAVLWSATDGSVSNSGMLSAPSVLSNIAVTVTATSMANPTKKAYASVLVLAAPTQNPPPPPPTQNPPPPPSSGPGPAPLGPDNRYCGSGDLPNFGSSDGPAALPKTCINTALVNTPSPGQTTLVPAQASLQTAVNNAACGDTLLLEAGATFGPLVLPAKNCDAAHWITIRTSSLDTALPLEGSRLNPCYAGVASLPARPSYNCSNPANVLARLQTNSAFTVISAAAGANYYRLIGLEITRATGNGIVYNLVDLKGADHIIFDRVWVHGSALPSDETTRGFNLSGSTYVGIIDSYINEFHCIAGTGTCTDSQAILGGNGTLPQGTWKIVNNFLESAAENILFGGAGGSANDIAADIEIRRNHHFKPPIWQPGNANFIGTNYIVKNLFEIKDAERVLFEGNVLDNTWGGFSQVGYGILLTPRGTWAAVQDITIRYCKVSHVGAGITIAASPFQSSTSTYDSIASQRISIHDVTIDDMNASAYAGSGISFLIVSAYTVNPPLNNVTINHTTVLTDRTLMVVGDNLKNPLLVSNITFTNNIALAGMYSVWAMYYGTTCAHSGYPLDTFDGCWNQYLVTNNSIIGYPNVNDPGPWPAGNYFPATPAAVGFLNYNNGVGGNYQLTASSPYANKGTDGKDLGADINALNQAIAGVP